MKEFVTIKQAARILQCSRARVRARIKRGTLVAHLDFDPKAGLYSGNMQWMIDRCSVEAVEAAREKA